jgi:heme exporter protein C
MTRSPERTLRVALSAAVVGVPIAISMLAIFLIAPTEQTMGGVQRIMYVHISVAWLGLLGFVIVAATGLAYLLTRHFKWDHWSQAAAELGWLCCTLTLMTGSLWASQAWNTWWTWDPRLTSAAVLWLIYGGYLLVRSNLADPHRRARTSAVLAIVGVLDVPLVVMATRWFRGMHPVSPQMEPSMRAILVTTALSLTAFFWMLLVQRRVQLGLESSVAYMERSFDRTG